MERETILTVVAGALLVVLLLSGGSWYLFLDTPASTPTDLDAKPPYPSEASVDAYTVSANASRQSLTNESDWSQWATVVRYESASNAKYGRLTTASPRRNVSIEAYHRAVGDHTERFERYHSTATDEFQYRTSTVRDDLDPQTESLRVINDTQTYYHFERIDRQDDLGMGNVRIGVVVLPPYEEVGTTTVDGRTVTKYVPVTGWVDIAGDRDEAPEAFVYDTTGAVYVSRSTGPVMQADVAFSTKRTEMRIGRWVGTTGNRIHIRLAVTRAVTSAPLEPEWVTQTKFDSAIEAGEFSSNSTSRDGLSGGQSSNPGTGYRALRTR
jgi:hypothetical protein